MKKVLLLVVILSLITLSACTVSDPPEETPSPPTISTPMPEATASPAPTASPELPPSPEPTYTADDDSIRQLAEDKFSFDYADLSVSWDDFDEAYVVSFRPTALPADETAWVYQSINRYIKFSQYAYKIDGVERVRFDIAATGTDQRGNEVSFDGLSVLMTRETFDLYDWDGLSYTNIWDTFVTDCYVFSLDPAFSAQLDSSKISYDPYLLDGMIT